MNPSFRKRVLLTTLSAWAVWMGWPDGLAPASAEGPSAAAAASAPGSVGTRTAAELGAALRAHQVGTDDYARSVFYTWTSPAQVEALRSSHTLLVATAQSTGRPSPFLRLLSELNSPQKPGHELAALLLDHPLLQRRRYAWTSPFATVMGLGERTYGEALIEVVLRPEAIIGRLVQPQRQGTPLTFVDLRGNPVAASEVLAHPERLAAIFHHRPPAAQEPTDFVPFREYILCNETMVKQWSVGTPAIRDRIAAEAALLRELRSHFAALSAKEAAKSAVPAWAGVAAAAPLFLQWRAALAFDNRKYRPLPSNIDQIVAALGRYDPTPPMLSYQAAR